MGTEQVNEPWKRDLASCLDIRNIKKDDTDWCR